MTISTFENCEICGARRWTEVYSGSVRAGSYGNSISSVIAQCNKCSVLRLNEADCIQHSSYESEEYRASLGETHDENLYHSLHDWHIKYTLNLDEAIAFRNNVVVDVGCGAGSLLDHVSGLAQSAVGIEPNKELGSRLTVRGLTWFPSLGAAIHDLEDKVDLVICNQVIEHVENPLVFLKDIFRLLKKGGILILSTPNLNDILSQVCPDAFPSFFYRTQHRWYFDAESLKKAAELAQFKDCRIKFVHRYGLSNALYWIKDNKPHGGDAYPGITTEMDMNWKRMCERQGQSDCLYLIARK
jgi:2-polyprenyl-3-methyl-5-hydroxy-6-metoxy-1,4-benzoquinol methylase